MRWAVAGSTLQGGTLNANNSTDSTIGALTLTADSTLNLSPGGAAAILTFAGVLGMPTASLPSPAGLVEQED